MPTGDIFPTLSGLGPPSDNTGVLTGCGSAIFTLGSPGNPALTMGPSIDGSSIVTFGRDFKTAIQSELKEYLKYNLLADVIRWKDDSERITVQIVLDGQVITEKTFLLE